MDVLTMATQAVTKEDLYGPVPNISAWEIVWTMDATCIFSTTAKRRRMEYDDAEAPERY